jgi:hypothetical protein
MNNQDRMAKELLEIAKTALANMGHKSMALYCFADGGASVSFAANDGSDVEYTFYNDRPLTKKVEVLEDD